MAVESKVPKCLPGAHGKKWRRCQSSFSVARAAAKRDGLTISSEATKQRNTGATERGPRNNWATIMAVDHGPLPVDRRLPNKKKQINKSVHIYIYRLKHNYIKAPPLSFSLRGLHMAWMRMKRSLRILDLAATQSASFRRFGKPGKPKAPQSPCFFFLREGLEGPRRSKQMEIPGFPPELGLMPLLKVRIHRQMRKTWLTKAFFGSPSPNFRNSKTSKGAKCLQSFTWAYGGHHLGGFCVTWVVPAPKARIQELLLC